MPKHCQQIALPFVHKKTPTLAEKFQIKLRETAQLRVIAVTLLLPSRQIDQKIEMPNVALAQKIVLQHRAKRGRNRHRELERDVVIRQALQHLQQRNVGLGDRFEEPRLFEELLVFRVPNERQVRVKNERELPGHERGISQQLADHANPTLTGAFRPPSPETDDYGESDDSIATTPDYSVRQKSWNRSRPFLMTSMLVA